jgi:hypothetical protein
MATMTLLTMTMASAWSATPDERTVALIRSLARPAPASVEFTEVRFSPLLKEPLIVAGDLGYTAADSLDRHVRTPYREDTEIRGESVRVVREGEPARSFALKRAPELRMLLSGFAGLLTGDAAIVGQTFDTSLTEHPSPIEHAEGAHSWTLTLTPTDARARKRLKSIEVTGNEATPRCFKILMTDGGASVMLLGDATQTPLDARIERAQLDARCAGKP